MLLRLLPSSLLAVALLSGCNAKWNVLDGDGDGVTVLDGDCDDGDATVYPGAAEIWYDGKDEDCLAGSDNDADGDGHDASAAGGDDCWDEPGTYPDGFVAVSGAVQLEPNEVYPGALEVWYDGIDGDCSGGSDFDQDGDGHDADDALQIDGEAGDDCYDAVDPGCDTFDASDTDCSYPISGALDPEDVYDPYDIHPGETDTWYDGTDQDCAGNSDYDADEDGFDRGEECDDTDPSAYPNDKSDPWYDGIDANCDGNDGDQDGDGYYITDYPYTVPEDYLDYQGDCYDRPEDAGLWIAINGYPDPAADDVHPDAYDQPYDNLDENCDGSGDFDADGDGYTSATEPDADGNVGTDCNDDDPDIHPGGVDTWYDGVDSDCAGNDDYDQDRDGYQDPSSGTGTDCDDNNNQAHPDQNERCDTAFDDDCDGNLNDQDATGCSLFYSDVDGDSHAGTASECLCEGEGAYTYTGHDDCDDTTPTTYPGSVETCGTYHVDDDCDGDYNELGAASCTTRYYDGDSDGFGTTASECRCEAAGAYTATVSSDCDDTKSAVSPSGTETCGTAYDDDCDGSSNDIGAVSCTTYYTDSDSDGYGTTPSQCTCTGTGVYTATVSTDCDDTKAAVSPAGTETCGTAYDDDCDGSTNDIGALSCTTYYTDVDTDGYGTSPSQCTCAATGTYTATVSTDCDDTKNAVHPGATETCATSYDDDCDSSSNDIGATGCHTYYNDSDGDTYGTSTSQCTCTTTGTYTATVSTDCDDTKSAVNPAATETCATAYDDDCDSSSNDIGATGCHTYYNDTDADSYGTTTSQCTCSTTGTYTATVSTDCDDTKSAVHPGATESCATAYDDDCDSSTNDPGATGCHTYYNDSDGDTYGTSTSSCLCTTASPYTASVSTDCDDTKSAVNPAATETCATAYDDDCDSSTNDPGATGCHTYYNDSDGDTYGTSTSSCLCTTASPYTSSTSTDCDDTRSAVHPGATETCATAYDDDCDSSANDIGATSCTNHYYDSDNDDYGTSAVECVCTDDGNYRGSATGDCNDSNSAIRPGATETCNSVDDDCDSVIDDGVQTYRDLDGDNQGAGTGGCTTGSGYVSNNTDCDDTDVYVFAGATELCDGQFNNCTTSSSWTTASENGKVTLMDASGGMANQSWSTSSSSVSTFTATGDSTLFICAGTYYVRVSNGGYSLTLDGDTSSNTILDANNTGSVLSITGGGVSTASHISFKHGSGTSVASNTYGGGVYVYMASATGNTDLTLTDCVVSNNAASTYGGGVAARGAAVVDIGTSTVNNNSAGKGAGLYVGGTSIIDMTDTLVRTNTAATDGGGAWLEGTLLCTGGSGSYGLITNTSTSGHGGGAFLANTGSPSLTSTTCDWGNGTTENSPSDVEIQTGASTYQSYNGYHSDETFGCTSGSSGACTP